VKVLFLGSNYHPEQMGIGPHTATLSEALVQRGHAVQVCTTFPHFPAWRIADGYRGRVRSREVLEGVVVLRSWSTMGGGRNALRRILYETSLSTGILLNSLTFTPDVVVSISPPIQLGIAGALLARRSKTAHVLAVKDLPMDLALATGMMRRGVPFRVGKIMEQATYRLADLITVITDGFTRRLSEDGVPPAKEDGCRHCQRAGQHDQVGFRNRPQLGAGTRPRRRGCASGPTPLTENRIESARSAGALSL
jgi:hypothetical protein